MACGNHETQNATLWHPGYQPFSLSLWVVLVLQVPDNDSIFCINIFHLFRLFSSHKKNITIQNHLYRKLNVKNERDSINIQTWLIASWQPSMEQKALTHSFIPPIVTRGRIQMLRHIHHADIKHNNCCPPNFPLGKQAKPSQKREKKKESKTNKQRNSPVRANCGEMFDK